VYVVQFLVDVLLFTAEKLDFLINPVSDGMVCGFLVLLPSTVDLHVYVARFDLLYFAHFLEPYCRLFFLSMLSITV
jgi:hypothetical protein